MKRQQYSEEQTASIPKYSRGQHETDQSEPQARHPPSGWFIAGNRSAPT